jgi:hypothetical protein
MESVRLACVRHAASVRPEPGSNSPSRLLVNPFQNEKRPSKNQRVTMYDSSMVTTDRHFTKDCSLDPSRPALLLIDVQPRRTEARMNCPHWLLALTIPFSRSDRAHTSTAGVGAGCSEGLFRTDCSAGKSPSVPAGLTLWGHFRREDYCTRRAADRQRTLRETSPRHALARAPDTRIPPCSRPLVDTFSVRRTHRPPPRSARVPRSPH